MINTMILAMGLLYLMCPSSGLHSNVPDPPPKSLVAFHLAGCGDPLLDQLNVDPDVRAALCRMAIK